MATEPKKKISPRGKPAVPPAHRAAPPASRPFLRFYHSEALRKSMLKVLDAVEEAADPTAHRVALADVIIELMHSGFDAYFLEPLKAAKAGFIIQQSASLGLTGAQQLMGTVIRNIIGRMDGPQLVSLCGSIRALMR